MVDLMIVASVVARRWGRWPRWTVECELACNYSGELCEMYPLCLYSCRDFVLVA